MDMFKLGQMLGNAYGNLWVANANKRDDKKIEDIKNNLNKPEAQNEIAELGPTVGTLDPNTSIEDVNQAISQNAAISGGPQGITYNKGAGVVGNIPQRANNINPADVTTQGGILGLDGSENTGIAWRPRFSAEDLDKAMKEQGIGKESRDRALAQYVKETAQQAQEQMLPGVLDKIAGDNPREALRDIFRYSQYDPATANVLMKDYDKALAYDQKSKANAQNLATRMAIAQMRQNKNNGTLTNPLGGKITLPKENDLLSNYDSYVAKAEEATTPEAKNNWLRMAAKTQAELEALKAGPQAWYSYKYGGTQMQPQGTPQQAGGTQQPGGIVVGTEKAGNGKTEEPKKAVPAKPEIKVSDWNSIRDAFQWNMDYGNGNNSLMLGQYRNLLEKSNMNPYASDVYAKAVESYGSEDDKRDLQAHQNQGKNREQGEPPYLSAEWFEWKNKKNEEEQKAKRGQ